MIGIVLLAVGAIILTYGKIHTFMIDLHILQVMFGAHSYEKVFLCTIPIFLQNILFVVISKHVPDMHGQLPPTQPPTHPCSNVWPWEFDSVAVF